MEAFNSDKLDQFTKGRKSRDRCGERQQSFNSSRENDRCKEKKKRDGE